MTDAECVQVRAGDVVFADELQARLARFRNDQICDLILSLDWLRLTPLERASLREASRRLRRRQ